MYKRVTGIYAIRHQDKCYFGSAVCIKGRINMHKRELRNKTHSNHVLQRVFDKYGDGVEFVVVEQCTRSELRSREQHYIDTFKGRLLNLANQVCELAPPEEHSKRMKRAWAKRTPEQKAAMSKKISETLKARYREDPAALKQAQEALVKGRSSKALKKRKTSPEANEKRRQAALNQWSARSAAERKAVSQKITVGMMEKSTPEERSERSKAGGHACKGKPKTRKTA